MFIFLYTVFRNSSISDEHVFCVALHFTIGQIIFIIFASNKVFLSTHWLPIALPFNSLILSDWSQLNSLPLWIVGVTLLFICLIDYRTKK